MHCGAMMFGTNVITPLVPFAMLFSTVMADPPGVFLFDLNF
jgi:hypothetical protein